MKKLLSVLLVAVSAMVFVGCEETQTFSQGENYKGGPIRVDEGVYFKKVYIQGIYALLQCDKDGNILKNQNISTGYQQGKVFVSASVLTPTLGNKDTNGAFNFKCTDINDCYNQVLVVKNSMGK